MIENWLGLFVLIVFGAVVNLVIAFFMLRGLASSVGIPPEVNTSSQALRSLLIIVPVAGVAGAPFFLIPFIGPLLGIFVSGCVAPLMLAERYLVTQAVAAKVIVPTVAAVYIVSGVILYYGLPMIFPMSA